MSFFGDFFGDMIGSESTIKRLARAMQKQWGEGAMKVGTEMEPTDFQKFLWVRGGFFAEMRSYVEATYEQAFPSTAEYEVEEWESMRKVPPPPAAMLLGDRLDRVHAYCQAMMGSVPERILEAIEIITGEDSVAILEHRAADVTLDPEQIFVFWTLITAADWANASLLQDIVWIVDRWKPAHTQHGRNLDNPLGGVRVGSDASVSTPVWFKTGAGPEKTSRNLIQL